MAAQLVALRRHQSQEENLRARFQQRGTASEAELSQLAKFDESVQDDGSVDQESELEFVRFYT